MFLSYITANETSPMTHEKTENPIWGPKECCKSYYLSSLAHQHTQIKFYPNRLHTNHNPKLSSSSSSSSSCTSSEVGAEVGSGVGVARQKESKPTLRSKVHCAPPWQQINAPLAVLPSILQHPATVSQRSSLVSSQASRPLQQIGHLGSPSPHPDVSAGTGEAVGSGVGTAH